MACINYLYRPLFCKYSGLALFLTGKTLYYEKTLLIGAAFLSATLISSCAKTGYTCYCQNPTTYPATTQSYPLSGTTRSDAQSQCNTYSNNWVPQGGSCSLN